MKPADELPPLRPPSTPARLDPAAVAALFVQHAEELRRFLIGVLRNHEQANDVLQMAFAKAIELGHTAREDSLKSWLFRVAFNEAIVIKRKQAIAQRANVELASRGDRQPPPPELDLVRWETVAAVRGAIEQLPAEQSQVVRMRIYEDKKFVDIASELQLPLGTVLTRMQLALKKLKKHLDQRRGSL